MRNKFDVINKIYDQSIEWISRPECAVIFIIYYDFATLVDR